MKKDIKGYNLVVPKSNNINLEKLENNYVLFPVWMLNIKYKDKIYTFAMNGQTGKLIGDIPIDKTKAILLWLGVFIITFIVAFLIGGNIWKK